MRRGSATLCARAALYSWLGQLTRRVNIKYWIMLALGVFAWLLWGYMALTWHPLEDVGAQYQQYNYKPELR
jgi:uncharacterized protein with PQ loop repeat